MCVCKKGVLVVFLYKLLLHKKKKYFICKTYYTISLINSILALPDTEEIINVT